MSDLDRLMEKMQQDKGSSGEEESDDKDDKLDEEDDKLDEEESEDDSDDSDDEDNDDDSDDENEETPKIPIKKEVEEKKPIKKDENAQEEETIAMVEHEVQLLQNSGIYRRELLAKFTEFIEIQKLQIKLLIDIRNNGNKK